MANWLQFTVKCNTVHNCALYCLATCLGVLLCSVAFAAETEEVIQKILFSGDINNEDATRLQESIYKDLGVTGKVTEECKNMTSASSNELISASKNNTFDLGNIISGAQKCADSLFGNKKRSSKMLPPPLPRFHDTKWKSNRLKFQNSYYKVKSAYQGDTYIGWPQAQNKCWRDSRGRLVVIESKKEDQFIQGLVKNKGSSYIGIYREFKYAGEKKPHWIRHVASGKDSSVDNTYSNWLPDEPGKKLGRANVFNSYLGYWGIYEMGKPSKLRFWSKKRLGWRTRHPGLIVDNPVQNFICEWDESDWKNISGIRELLRNRTFNTNGGVSRIDGQKFKF